MFGIFFEELMMKLLKNNNEFLICHEKCFDKMSKNFQSFFLFEILVNRKKFEIKFAKILNFIIYSKVCCYL